MGVDLLAVSLAVEPAQPITALVRGDDRIRMEVAMIETLVVLGCVLGCFVVVAAPVPPSEAIDPKGARASATRRAELRLAGTVLAVTGFACLSLLAVSYGATGLVAPLLAGLVLANLVLHPWFLVRFVFIPFGLPRWAHRTSRLGGHPWVRDPEGGACLAGALACARRRKPDPAARRAIRDALARGGPLRGAGIVAAAFLDADAGEIERARRLLESLDLLDPDACPPRARDVARDWLVADAAQHGQWSRVLELSSSAPVPCPTMRFVRLAAQALLGEPVSVTTLLAAWIRAPRRHATWSLLRMAIASARRSCTEARVTDGLDAPAANDGAAPHHRAVAMHLEAALGSPDDQTLTRVAAGWDTTLWAPEFRAHLRARIRDLGGRRSPDRTALELRRGVARDLGAWWGATSLAAWGPGDLLHAAREEIVRDAARGLGSAVETLSRCGAESPLAVWQAWLSLREHHGILVASCSPARLRAFFAAVDHVVGALVVHLHDTRGQRSLAHAMSLWLVQEAERVHDGGAAAHHRMAVVLGP